MLVKLALRCIARRWKMALSAVLKSNSRQTVRTDITDYLTVHRLSLLNGFTFFSFFFNFSFQNRFPLQLFFSSSLLSTPIFPTIFVCW